MGRPSPFSREHGTCEPRVTTGWCFCSCEQQQQQQQHCGCASWGAVLDRALRALNCLQKACQCGQAGELGCHAWSHAVVPRAHQYMPAGHHTALCPASLQHHNSGCRGGGGGPHRHSAPTCAVRFVGNVLWARCAAIMQGWVLMRASCARHCPAAVLARFGLGVATHDI